VTSIEKTQYIKFTKKTIITHTLVVATIITKLQYQKMYRHLSKLKYVSIPPQEGCLENTSARVFHKGITKQQSIFIKKVPFRRDYNFHDRIG